ncbi:MAG: fasciclin domain-containing protein, partial [Rubricoccaceae bacterium]|nr:fasciclin domain-containing protein [Rubricoccaceae bacterium]
MPFRLAAFIGFLLVANSLSGCDSATTTETATDIPGILASEGNYSMLVNAILAAGLQSTLQGAGPFTVFAPTDLAFEFLGEETTDRLLDE